MPAAIVFGGGVPRDMHRLSQVFGASMADKNLQECLAQLAKEDCSACEDMVLMHTQLSDEGKQFWLKILACTGFTSKEETAALLREIETHTLENFIAMNACSGDKAKEHFHRLARSCAALW